MDTCPVCLNQTDHLAPLSCHHFFCDLCLKEVLGLGAICPLCRAKVEMVNSMPNTDPVTLNFPELPPVDNPWQNDQLDQMFQTYQEIKIENQKSYQQYLRDREIYAEASQRLKKLAEQGLNFETKLTIPQFQPKEISFSNSKLVICQFRKIKTIPIADHDFIYDENGFDPIECKQTPELSLEETLILFGDSEHQRKLNDPQGSYDLSQTLMKNRRTEFRYYPGRLVFYNSTYLDVYTPGDKLVFERRFTQARWPDSEVMPLLNYVLVRPRDPSGPYFLSIATGKTEMVFDLDEDIYGCLEKGPHIYLYQTNKIDIWEHV